jgi:hypothetical protein
MKNKIYQGIKDTRNLNELVAGLIAKLLPAASSRNSFFINEIPVGISFANSSRELMSETMSNLLKAIIDNTDNNCILISAGAYGGIIFLTIKDSGNLSSFNVDSRVEELQQQARKLGGCISVVRQRVADPCIAFSFPNKTKAA